MERSAILLPMDFKLWRPDGDARYTNFTWALPGNGPSEISVRNGRVAESSDGPMIDLAGANLIPAFIDAHCHILPTGLDLQKLHLGACSTHDEVLDAVRQRHQELPEGAWLLAVHYDQTKYSGIHLHKDQLDAISSDRPILLRHVNGHASVANSATLQAAKVTDATPDPKGGTYVKDASGRLTGVLLERAHEFVTAAAPSPTTEEMVDAIMAAGEAMASYGVTCATDMMTGRYDLARELEAYRLAAERGCAIRTRLCIQWAELFGPRAKPVDELIAALDGERCRVWGAKIFADGAIGSATAAVYEPYVSEGGTGQLIYAPEKLMQMVRTAHEAGWRIAIHTIGDRSTDLVMDAYEALDEPARHRIEHAMILSDAQIDRMLKLGVHCTMQPEFLARFGHSYRHHLGAERASRLKRFRSVKDAGIPLSFNSDRPIVAGDPWLACAAASNRPEGYDPAENLTYAEALEAYTVMGAVANNDPAPLSVGQPAEFITWTG